MKRSLLDSVKEIKSYIKQESEKDNWTEITLVNVCSLWNLPQYFGRRVLILLRIDPEIRYYETSSSSRFKPKAFFFSSPEEKIKDIGKVKQFELDQEEELEAAKKLNEYKNVENLRLFYILMYFLEKMKTSGYGVKWKNIDVEDFSKTIDVTKEKILQYIDILAEKKLIIKSPYTLNYKLTILENDYDKAKKEIAEESIDPNLIPIGEVNMEVLNTDSYQFNDLQATLQMRDSVKELLLEANKLTVMIVEQTKILDSLAKEEKNIKMQKTALIALNDSYNKLSEEEYQLNQKYTKEVEKNKILNKFLVEYQKHIEDLTTDLISGLSYSLETYFQQPIHKKNNKSFNDKTKVDILNVIFEFQKQVLSFKKDNNID